MKEGHGIIENTIFFNSYGDAIDYDRSGGYIKGCYFNNITNDAIDISVSNITIFENEIDGAGDKGLSVGEMSYPLIINNLIKFA